jgi:anti-anti-sigma factor
VTGLFEAHVRFDDPAHVVVMTGELDMASRAAAFRGCTSVGTADVVVDMAGLVFMDCAGYGALIAARAILERGGGSLTFMDPRGQPLRLLTLIGEHWDESEFDRALSSDWAGAPNIEVDAAARHTPQCASAPPPAAESGGPDMTCLPTRLAPRERRPSVPDARRCPGRTALPVLDPAVHAEGAGPP